MLSLSGHEYAQDNLEFAASIEPDNAALQVIGALYMRENKIWQHMSVPAGLTQGGGREFRNFLADECLPPAEKMFTAEDLMTHSRGGNIFTTESHVFVSSFVCHGQIRKWIA